jgi:hypothetical protein
VPLAYRVDRTLELLDRQRIVLGDPLAFLSSPVPRGKFWVFRYDWPGHTHQVMPERGGNFVPIAKPRKKTKDKQLTFDE